MVYKNKNGGERVVRYRGTDEAYAVNELYQRLKIEIANQKSRNALEIITGDSGSLWGSCSALHSAYHV